MSGEPYRLREGRAFFSVAVLRLVSGASGTRGTCFDRSACVICSGHVRVNRVNERWICLRRTFIAA